jgi:hypothetical protein
MLKLKSKVQSKSKLLSVIAIIALFAFGGIITLVATHAATPFISVEAEAGTLTGGACAGTDTTASDNNYVQFSTTCGSSSLPAGVTLQDIDGGQTYFEQWSNSFSSARQDPTFFPITVFAAHDIGFLINGKSRAQLYKEMGINTFVSLYNGALSGSPKELDVVKSQGMRAIIDPNTSYFNQTFNTTYGNTASGYSYQDEIEGNPCSVLDYDYLLPFCTDSGGKIDTLSFVRMTNEVKSRDGNTRPVYQGFTHSFLQGYINTDSGDAYQHIIDGGDIIGYDAYVMTDRRFSYYTGGKTWAEYQTVAIARNNMKNMRPIWPDIETSEVDTFNTICYRPTPADMQSMVWNAIIAGARGITYFNNNFASNCPNASLGSHILLNSTYSDIRAGVTNVNTRVKNLAPVINSKFANGFETHNGQINSMTKYYNNQFYIFATPKASGAQTVTFTVKTGSSVSVVDESRTIPISGGAFSDTFANDTTAHIYKINP